MPRKPLLALVAAALAALSLGLAACGDDDDSSDAPEPAATTAAPPATAPPAASATVLDLTADPDGALAFTETELTAPAGSVTLKLTNAAAIPHNVAVDGNGVDSPASGTIQDGGTSEITVDLPAGTYTYYCAVPGHREGGMEGTLTVE